MRELTKQQQRILEILAQGLPIKSYRTKTFNRSNHCLLAFSDHSKNLRRT